MPTLRKRKSTSPGNPAANKGRQSKTRTPKRRKVTKTNFFVDGDVDENERVTASEDEINDEEYTPASQKKGKNNRAKNLTSPRKRSLNKTEDSTPVAKRKRRSTAKKVLNVEHDASIFAAVLSGQAMQMTIDDWITHYNQNNKKGLIELVQFIVHCCGCKGIVTEEMLKESENIKSIQELTLKFDEDSNEYPIIMTGPKYKKLKGYLRDFIVQFVAACQNDIIYDDDVMVVVVSWLIRLADSQVRAFRHTSTFLGMHLGNGLITVITTVKRELEVSQHQLQNEKRKSSSKKGRDKIDTLTAKCDRLKENVSFLENLLKNILTGVFVHRYRDINPQIRTLCIEQLGNWIRYYSPLFLNDNCMKYIGWTLNDKVSSVRIAAVKVLQELYSVANFSSQLNIFTKRFCERMIIMTSDKECDVCVESIKLMTILLRYEDILDDVACAQVYRLVFCSNPNISHAAGEFLSTWLFSGDNDTEKDDGVSTDLMKKKAKIRMMKDLIRFFIDTEVHELADYLVDSLWNSTELLKDWEIMTGMLLGQHLKEDEEPLDDEEEFRLIKIMCCAIKQGSVGHGPPGRQMGKKGFISSKEKRAQRSLKDGISTHFSFILPKLLAKFSAEREKIGFLVEIPQYMDLDAYGEMELQNVLEALLKQIEGILDKHTDMEVLDVCAKTLRCLLGEESNVKTAVEVTRHKIMDRVTDEFKEIFGGTGGKEAINDNVERALSECDHDTEINMLTYLRKIIVMHKEFNIKAWECIPYFNAVVDYGLRKSINDEMLCLAMSGVQLSLAWEFSDDEAEGGQLKTGPLLENFNHLLRMCDELMQFGNSIVQKKVFCILCDTLMMVSKPLMESDPATILAYETDRSIQIRCRDFIVSCVFDVDEDFDLESRKDDVPDSDYEMFCEKRNLLAAFCKLIVYKIFDTELAAPVFANYLKRFKDFGDIIKYVMTKVRQSNLSAYTTTILLSLQQAFESVKFENLASPSSVLKDIEPLKELARRFGLTFGVESLKSQSTRQNLINLHRDGIKYALEKSDDVPTYPRLPFLVILNEFSCRLLDVDKSSKTAGVLPFLEDLLPSELKSNMRNEELYPLRIYFEGLKGEKNNAEEAADIEDDKDDKADSEPVEEPQEDEWLSKDKAVKEQKGKRKSKGRRSMRSSGRTAARQSNNSINNSNDTTSKDRSMDVEDSQKGAKVKKGKEVKTKDNSGKHDESEIAESISKEAVESESSDSESDYIDAPDSQESWLASQPKEKKSSRKIRYNYSKLMEKA
ncbi:Cohesin subunit SA-2 [Trichoplax sp. H2]|nr:Cohesin subunit SA-2 [Trichoplax sp. H2]|eukprot:RDD46055.1 Cohesin subunit SA-2 [Trichoplax sp. H2]